MKTKRAVFLDRDGTINIDKGYIKHPDEVELISGVSEALERAKKAGFLLSIITNQAGVAKGITPKEQLPKIHNKIETLISRAQKEIPFAFDDIQICTHHPDDKCQCRKPNTKLVEQSIEKLQVDPERSYFIGDKYSDLLCATRLNIKPILVSTGHGRISEPEVKHSEIAKKVVFVKDLSSAIDWILKDIKNS
ncbi:MAG: D-glycero-alpha-D-manno-heptose-1,7-bisphosphate 7-phosphatase [Bacteriovoracia bacterium]